MLERIGPSRWELSRPKISGSPCKLEPRIAWTTAGSSQLQPPCVRPFGLIWAHKLGVCSSNSNVLYATRILGSQMKVAFRIPVFGRVCPNLFGTGNGTPLMRVSLPMRRTEHQGRTKIEDFYSVKHISINSISKPQTSLGLCLVLCARFAFVNVAGAGGQNFLAKTLRLIVTFVGHPNVVRRKKPRVRIE